MHPASEDLIVGRHVLERGLVPRDKLLRCLCDLAEARRSGSVRALGSILVSRGLITDQQLTAALPKGASAGQASPAGWQFLAASAILSAEALDHCLRVQEEDRLAGRDPAPVEQLAVRLGYATEQQVSRVLSESERLLHVCRGCGNRVPLGPLAGGARYRCRRCGGEMAPLDQIANEAETDPLTESPRPADEQLEIDGALASFVKQRGLVRRDRLREAERFQAECLEYGFVVCLRDVLRKTRAISWQQEQELAAIDFGRLVEGAAWKKEPIRGYRLLSRLAAGGFATLYTAESIFTGARVAVKMLLGERREDERAVARFEREAALLRKLHHPNIVRALEYGEDGGQRYLIMELVEGRSLGQTLSEGGAFPVRNALAVTRQIAEALRYLHTEGYLHRDIKPDNVLMESSGHVRLCDLGFTVEMPAPSPAGARKTLEGGTAGYVAPELARGESDSTVGPDIYALGITLFSLLTGYEPFKGESSMEFVTAQFDAGLPVPNLLSVKAPPGVIRLLQAMTHPARERRLSSAVEVVAAIDRLLKG